MPKLGEAMEEGQIVDWLVEEGEEVEKNDPIFEVMTDKSTMEFPSPESGVMLKHLVELEEDYACGTPVCIIGEEGEDISELL